MPSRTSISLHASGKVERSKTIAVEAERWGVVGREQSCDHL